MAIQQLANLPGVQVDLRDGGLRSAPSPLPPITDSLIIIGTAIDGPAMVPVRATSIDQAITVFGSYTQADNKTPNGTTLIPALKQAVGAGARNVYLMRINGTYAAADLSVTFVEGVDYTLTLNADPTPDTLARTATSRIPDGAVVDVYKDGVKVESVTLTGTTAVDLTTDVSTGTIAIRMTVGRIRGRFQGASYNAVKYAIDAAGLSIWSREDTDETVATKTFAFTGDGAYATIGLLASAVNATSVDHDAVLEIANWDLSALPPTLLTQVAETALTGGDDQLNLPLGSYSDTTPSVRSLLKQAYDAIAQSYPASMIVPKLDGITVYPNELADANQLAETCHQMAVLSQFELTPIGFLAVKPIREPVSPSVIASRVAALKSANFSFVASDGTDIGRYLSLVFGEPIFNDEVLGLYADTGEVVYAGFVSSLAANRSPLNRAIPGVVGMRYSVNLQQADELTGARLVVLNERSTTGPYVVDSPTAARPDSDYRRLTTMRIAQLVANRTRQIALPFLGEPLDVPAFTTLNANLRQMAEDLKAGGFVQDLTFAVNLDPNDPNVLVVAISMVPVFEVKRVRIPISLRLPQPMRA